MCIVLRGTLEIQGQDTPPAPCLAFSHLALLGEHKEARGSGSGGARSLPDGTPTP